MKLVLLVAAFAALVLPAHADDYSAIPSSIRDQIKAKCVDRWPDDYTLQDGCIMNQSDSYLRVHGDEVVTSNTGVQSRDYVQAQIESAGYLKVAEVLCGLRVGTMPERYRQRALSHGKLTETEVQNAIDLSQVDQRAAVENKTEFCLDAIGKLGSFEASLAQP